SLSSLLQSSTEAVDDTVRLAGKAPAHVDPNYKQSEDPVVYDEAEGKGMRFEASLRAVAEGGSVRAEGGTLRIEGARAVTLLVSAATGYRGFDRIPDGRAAEIAASCRKVLDAAVLKGYQRLRADHIADHRRLFGRMALDLGTAPDLPTDEYLRRPDP